MKNIKNIEKEIREASYVETQTAKYTNTEGWNSMRTVTCPTVSKKARRYLRTNPGQKLIKEIQSELLEETLQLYNCEYWKQEKQWKDGSVFIIRNPNPIGDYDWEWKYVILNTPWF